MKPFRTGSQYEDWSSSNCDSCSHYKTTSEGQCEIAAALALAYIGDGEISDEIADRMGRPNERQVWPCLAHNPPFVNVRDGVVIQREAPNV